MISIAATTVILGLLYACALPHAYGSCSLPHPVTDPDFRKLTRQTWYQALHNSHDHVMTDDMCDVVAGFTLIFGGVKLEVESYHNVSTSGSEPSFTLSLQLDRVGAGIYQAHGPDFDTVRRREKGVDDRLYAEYIKNGDAAIIGAGHIAYLTDNEHYFIHIACSPEGSWIVWAYTPNPDPKSGDIDMIQQVLQQNAIHTVLRPTQCRYLAF